MPLLWNDFDIQRHFDFQIIKPNTEMCFPEKYINKVVFLFLFQSEMKIGFKESLAFSADGNEVLFNR